MEIDPLSKVNPDTEHTVQREIEWSDISSAVDKIVETIHERKYTIKQIFGCPRGGLVPAVMLSHRLKVPMVFDDTLFDKHTLIIDDAIEHGETVKEFLDKQPVVAILYRSERSMEDEVLKSYERFITVETKAANEWIIFPWEN